MNWEGNEECNIKGFTPTMMFYMLCQSAVRFLFTLRAAEHRSSSVVKNVAPGLLHTGFLCNDASPLVQTVQADSPGLGIH